MSSAFAIGACGGGGGKASIADVSKALSKPDATVDAATTKTALTNQDNQSAAGGMGMMGSPPSLGFIQVPEAAIPAFVTTNGASLFAQVGTFSFDQMCAGAKAGKTSLKPAFEAAIKQQAAGANISISGDITMEISCPTATSFRWEMVYDNFSISGGMEGRSGKFTLNGNFLWAVGATKIDGAEGLYYRWASKLDGQVTEDTKTTTIKFFGGAAAIAVAAAEGYKVKFAGAVLEVNGKFLLFYYRDTKGDGQSLSPGSGYAIIRGGNGSFVFYGEGSKGSHEFCIWSATTASPPVLTFVASEGLTADECKAKETGAGNLDTTFDVCKTYPVLCE